MNAIDDLRQALGADEFQRSADYAVVHDWTRRFVGPVVGVARPRSTESVALTLEVARSHSLPVVTQGGNTGLVGGGVPAPHQPALLLSTTALVGVTVSPHNPEHMIAAAGATLAQVQGCALGMGRRYGVDLAARDQATIGGTVATNAGGIRVCAYGMTRNQVVGVEFVLPDGSVVSDLVGHTRDNTGYNLPQLLSGSEGTLGVITAVSLRSVPAPGPTTLFAAPFETLEAAYKMVAQVRSGPDLLLAAEVVEYPSWQAAGELLGTQIRFTQSPEYVVLVEVADDAEARAIPAEMSEIAVALDGRDQRRMWAIRESQTELWAHAGLVQKFDISVPPTELDRFVQGWRSLMAEVDGVGDYGFFGHLADSNLHLQVVGEAADPDALEAAVLTLVADHGGSISAEHGVGRSKSPYLGLRRSEAEIAAMRLVKQAFDPVGIMNPGVLLPEANSASTQPEY